MSINRRYVIALFLLALGLRLVYLVEIRDTPYFNTLILDAEEYHFLARSVLSGDWLSAAHRTYVHGPLYPVLWSLVKLSLSGGDALAMRLFQAVLGALCCVFLYLIARRFFLHPTPLLAALLAAGYWPFILYNGELLATTLVVFIQLGLGVVLVQQSGRWMRWTSAGAGIVLGLLVATRSNTLLLVPVVLAWLYYQARVQGRAPVGLLVPFGVGLCGALAPFVLHNLLAQGTALPFQGAWSFYMGNNPAADGTPYARQGLSWKRLEILPYQAGMGDPPALRSRFYLMESLRFITAEPLAYLDLLYRKFRLFWHAFEIPVSADIQLYMAHSRLGRVLLGFGAMAPLALVGMLWNGTRWRETFLLYGFVLAYLVSGMLFTVCARYRLPAVPFLILFAAEALRQGVALVRCRDWRRLAIFMAVLGAGAAVVHTGVNPARVDHLRSHWLQGQVHMRNGEHARAEAAYLQALQQRPDDADIHSSLGVALEYLGRYQEAEAAYRKAIALAADHSRARLNLGRLLRRTNRRAQAEALFLQVLADDPRPVSQYEGHYYLGYLHLDRQDYRLAYQALRAAVAADRRPDGLYALANACHGLGYQDEQIGYLLEAVALQPDFAAAHRNLGALYLQRSEYAAAEQALKRAVALEPDIAVAHYNLGMLYMATGRRALGQNSLATAARLRREIDPAR